MVFMFKWNSSLVADDSPLLGGTGHQLEDTLQIRLIKARKHFRGVIRLQLRIHVLVSVSIFK